MEHRDLSSYARFWDVAMIPFRGGRLTEVVDPIKLYDDLYLGLPVVGSSSGSTSGATLRCVPLPRGGFEQDPAFGTGDPVPPGGGGKIHQ